MRDIQGKTVGEIVSLGEGSNSVILMSKTQVYWCKSIDGIYIK